MIVVDSSVWIDFLNGCNAPHVRRLRAILGIDEVIVGDLMLCEVLQGLESEQAARDVEPLLRRFEIVAMAGEAIAVTSARNFRLLRRRGITVRKTIDLLIGTWCIENRASLLHNDSDFHPMPAISDSGNSQIERGSFVARPHGSATSLRHLIEFIDENSGGPRVRL